MASGHVNRANKPNHERTGAEVKTARCHTLARGGSFNAAPPFHGVPGGSLRVPSEEFSLRNARLISPALFGPLNLLAGHHTLMRRPGFVSLRTNSYATATLAASKGRWLIRCTVPGSTPNCLAMTRTPGLPGVARASRIRFSSVGEIGGRPRRLPHFWPAQARHGLVPRSSHARTLRIRPSSETSPCPLASWCRGLLAQE
jgi:hypothetical protein